LRKEHATENDDEDSRRQDSGPDGCSSFAENQAECGRKDRKCDNTEHREPLPPLCKSKASSNIALSPCIVLKSADICFAGAAFAQILENSRTNAVKRLILRGHAT